MVLEQCSPVLLTGADLFVFNDIKYLSWSSVGMNRDCMVKYVTANELFFKNSSVLHGQGLILMRS